MNLQKILPEKVEKIFSDQQNELFDVEPVILKWKNIKEENVIEELTKLIQEKELPQEIAKAGLKPLSMSDVVFLTPSNEIGREIVNACFWRKNSRSPYF